jgi:transposase
MLDIPPSTKVFLCNEPVDMRKSFDALSGLVQTHFGRNPLCGHLFVFFSRQRDRIKILTWDRDGFILFYKRLECGTFSWIADARNKEISSSDFALMLAGMSTSGRTKTKSIASISRASLAQDAAPQR